MRWSFAVLLLLNLRIAAAQSPATPPPQSATPAASSNAPLLSPQAAYDQAGQPLDITRRDSSNWSDIELAALDVAQAQAKDACIARTSETYTGADLVGYARLCALGKQWPAVYLASTTYINADGPKPLLADAYTFEVQADLNLGRAEQGERTCIAMLRSVPYSSTTDEVTSATIRFLQFAYLPLALDLALQRQPYVLDLLRAAQPAASPQPSQPAFADTPLQPLAPATVSDIPLHTLFEDALILPELQQFNNDSQRAAAELADIDRATPTSLPSDEAIFIAADRRQYALIGTPFPLLPGAVSLQAAVDTPLSQPHLGQSTIFLLFPPWCVQCITQTKDIIPTLVRESMINGSDAKLHIYALLADNPPLPPAKPMPTHTAPATIHRPGQPAVIVTEGKPPAAAEQLRKTPTLVVAPSTLTDFNATDFPFLIVVDRDGIIRLLVPAAPKNALVQGGPAEQIMETILQHWPIPFSAAPPPPPVSTK